ncbi:ADPribosylglycohydrolase superfamily protein [Oopsacas minuta]|uniref:ADPribosylglycohydrolase superfamily protein n=1 Tax=Oopsacas minuta TaxID=111878 RepID=A0AAV7KCA0_9METZ|nr:ADPribosylglycohydrolase superfamily protein [Oopsacas minuta]
MATTDPDPQPKEVKLDTEEVKVDTETDTQKQTGTQLPDVLVDALDAHAVPSPVTEEIKLAEPSTTEPSPDQELVSKKIKTDSPPIPPTSLPEVLFKPDWAPGLSREVIIDRIKGCIYGNALGDAMGLATEFLSRDELKKKYPKPGPIPFSDIVLDFHRYRWTKGDWTDDTDQMLLIMEGIIESGGNVIPVNFAHKLHNWARYGFPELGDQGGLGIGMTVHRTISHSHFLTEPHTAAREVWEESGKYLAANGAVMRTSVLGLVSFNNLESVIHNTLQISLTTHADPRCSASCVSVTTLIAQLLTAPLSCTKEELSSLIDKSIQEGAKLIEDGDKKKEFITHMSATSLRELNLDEAKAIGYTLKCAGTGFVGVKSKVKTAKDFIKFMTELVREGGDADTNGAVCGAVIGCKIGYDNLPHDWIQKMPHIKWLDDKVDMFLNCIGLVPDTSST